MQSWQTINTKFDALNKRERWLVFGALLFVIYAVINGLLLSPVLAKQKTLNSEKSTDQAQLLTLRQQLAILNNQKVVDPDAQNKQRIADLQSNIQQLDTQLSGMQTTLINPEKMPDLLRSLLKKNGKLKLIELKTSPATSLLDNLQQAEDTAKTSTQNTQQATAKNNSPLESPVFKHSVELTIEGQYLDLLEYVSELEKMPWHVLWSKAALNADQRTRLSQLKLTVYTLSLDQTWLSI
jgi:MSHA biogenesis protein MshJ